MKRCPRCRTEKPYSDYYKQSRAKDGCQPYCIACIKIARATNPDRHRAVNKRMRGKYKADPRVPTARACPGCGVVKEPSGFHRAMASPTGMGTYCKTCTSERDRQRYDRERNAASCARWQQANQERVRAYRAEYMRTHGELRNELERKRHARKRSADHGCVTVDGLRELLVVAGNRCTYCGVDLAKSVLNWDHVKPLKLGGLHCIENLTPSCESCNTSKQAMPLEQWLERRGVLF